jgi:hypothetical protein
MDTEDRSLLATLAYYSALRWPLTVSELLERRIPAIRCGAQRDVVATLDTLMARLENLSADGRIRASAGLYMVGDVPHDFVAQRVYRQAVSAQKWRAMLPRAWWLQVVPFVRMVSASGSLAMGSSSPQSDWDVFVVVKSGRLYTARLGLLAVAWLLGRLRTQTMQSAPDRFCFNHILTTEGLSLRHRSLYTAHAVAWHIPLYDPWGYAPRFRHANDWVAHYASHAVDRSFIRRSVSYSRILGAIRWLGELILTGPVGALCERVVRRWMQGRIRANPQTYARGGRIIADDRELEFHPRSFEATALSRYNAFLARFGMGQYAERDSGLTH